jgi:alkanesulfonate monooxygenase SsuD/methylene tetrahydromethanopterin reductase-like flavin-dependent oxidoreductase (luciferase family)
MNTIKLGFTMPADNLDKSRRGSYVSTLNRALDLISGHFDSAWIIDHLQFGEQDILEGFTTLSYVSALHPQLKFGHTVLCQSFRNPALLAKMAATLQFLTGGRFLLGIGAGWHEEEYKAYGYEFPPAGERVEQLEETLQIIKAMWTEAPATFEGKHYRIRQAYCEPKPEPVPPIMVGAFRPKMLRLAARYADEWNVSSTGLKRYERLSREMEKACQEVGRDPASLRRSWGGGCACASTQAQAERFARGLYNPDNLEDDFGFVGTPEQVTVQIRSLIDLGISTFMLDCGGFPDLTTLELLVKEVLPVLKSG